MEMKGFALEIILGLGWLGYWIYSNWLNDLVFGKIKFGEMLRKSHRRKAKMRTICDDLRRSIGASRVTILYANNGDRIPSGLGPVYSSIYISVSDEEADEEFERSWQQQEVDKDYIDSVILPIWDNGSIDLVVSDMNEGYLKNRYEAHRLTHARKHKLGYRKGKLWYVSIVGRKEINDGGAIDDLERAAFSSMRKILKKA